MKNFVCTFIIIYSFYIAHFDVIAAEAVKSSATEPLVARVQMELKSGEKIIDVIEKGDLLTAVEATDTTFTLMTHKGNYGRVSKDNVARLAEAVTIYTEMIKEAPKEGRLLTLRASAYWARGDKKLALVDFDRAIDLGYATVDSYSSRGMFHAAMGNYDLAYADHTQAIRQDAKSEVPLINRAAVLLTQNKPTEALRDYDAAIQLNSKNPTLYQQRALAWKAAGKPDRAIEDFGKAIEISPQHLSAIMGRGFVWYEQGKHAQAIEDFSTAIKINPKIAAAFNNRGFNYQQLGRATEALADYNEAVKLAPDYELAHQNRAWLLATAADEKIRNGKEAVTAALQACELSDYKNMDGVRALAAAFAEDQQFDKAIGWQEKVVAGTVPADQALERKVLAHYQAKKPFRTGDFADEKGS